MFRSYQIARSTKSTNFSKFPNEPPLLVYDYSLKAVWGARSDGRSNFVDYVCLITISHPNFKKVDKLVLQKSQIVGLNKLSDRRLLTDANL